MIANQSKLDYNICMNAMYPDAGFDSLDASHRVQVKELFPDKTIFAGVGLIFCADMLPCVGSMLLMHDLL